MMMAFSSPAGTFSSSTTHVQPHHYQSITPAPSLPTSHPAILTSSLHQNGLRKWYVLPSRQRHGHVTRCHQASIEPIEPAHLDGQHHGEAMEGCGYPISLQTASEAAVAS
jgi:hypothetical protein